MMGKGVYFYLGCFGIDFYIFKIYYEDMKILNMYSGIGGNRKLWGEDHNITAIEFNKDIAAVYKDFFPNDKLIITDAHKYLEDNYKEFDFIWSSPPCQSHSRMRINLPVKFRGTKAIYPDMKLYEEIIFLQYYFNGRWIVENVNPYYDCLIKPSAILQRHYFWSNFDIPFKKFESDTIRSIQIPDLQRLYGFNLSSYKLKNKRQVLRNCTVPEIGKYILEEIK